jgi:hypothetical protein
MIELNLPLKYPSVMDNIIYDYGMEESKYDGFYTDYFIKKYGMDMRHHQEDQDYKIETFRYNVLDESKYNFFLLKYGI